MNKKRFTSLIIKHDSWGLLAPNEDSSHELNIHRLGVVHHCIYNGACKKPSREYKYNVDKDEIENFFIYLENKININNWDQDYSLDVCDGYHWTIKVRYSDRSIKKIEGTMEPPPGGEKLERQINKIIPFIEKPWVF